MKHILVTLTALIALTSFAHAEESITEKAKEVGGEIKAEAQKAGRKAKRLAKKGVHKVQEATCTDGDVACAAKKVKNRIEEGKDATVDTVKDVKDDLSN